MTPMLRIGKLELAAPFFQAGLAGYSDAAMRLVARRHGAPYAVTEAMLDLVLVRGGKGLRAAEIPPEDHPIAGQLMGSNPSDIARGARVLVGLGYDVIDVNLACPVKKVRHKSRGGHLLGDPAQAVAVLDAVRQAVAPAVPCTVKLRRGRDDSPQAEADFHTIFAAAIRLGYAGATVHGRTVAQKYLGTASWPFLAGLVRDYGLGSCRSGPAPTVLRSLADSCRREGVVGAGPDLRDGGKPGFTLMGSGDIWTAQDIFRMIAQTGVHGVSVARGCIGNPWLFTQARALLAGDLDGGSRAPSVVEQRAVLLEHFELAMIWHGEETAARRMRKFGIKFARHHPLGDQVARAFIAVQTLDDWRGVLDRYYADDSGAQEGRPVAAAGVG
jgi:tRNA-dihydrouridine synthase